MRIVAERPDYSLFENNCQNFVKFLLEVVCPGGPIPATIQLVLERLHSDISSPRQRLSLPGAYPPSIISTERLSFVTASGTSWITASGDSWVTAVEYASLRDAHSQLFEGRVHANSSYRSIPRASTFEFVDENIVSPLMDAIPTKTGPTLVQNSHPRQISQWLPAWLRKKPRQVTDSIPDSRAVAVYKIVVLGCRGTLPYAHR
jgi:hypothetical protein